MPARFCPQCGTAAVAGAKFCIECGAPLGGGTAAGTRGWRVTTAGLVALGGFLAAGLAIWTVILSPAPPHPALGGRAAAPAADAAAAPAASGMPEGHPPVTMPPEVTTFMTELAAKAKADPSSVETWSKLAQVNYRAAQLDPAYYPDALAAFEHVLELQPKNTDALRGVANVHYDRDEHQQAIPFYERYLAERPDDLSAWTDLGTMYLYAGDPAKAVATFKKVLEQNPSFLQAHYNLAVTYHQQGDDPGALAELKTARGLATDEGARKQIDEMIASLTGTGAAPAADRGPRSPFQTAVEQAFKSHPIMGPRIVRFDWTGPAAGRVVVRNFPMESMPPAVREKFAARLAEQIRTAQSANQVEGAVKMDIADASSGTVMATVTP